MFECPYCSFDRHPEYLRLIEFFIFSKILLIVSCDFYSKTMRDLFYVDSFIIFFHSVSPFDNFANYPNISDICSYFLETLSPEGCLDIFSILDSSTREFMVVVFSYVEDCYLSILTREDGTSCMACCIFFSFKDCGVSDDCKWCHIT